MKNKFLSILMVSLVLYSCKKSEGSVDPVPPPPPPSAAESVPLKSIAPFTIALAANYNTLITNTSSSAIIKRDFNGVTFENEMKNSSLINGSGQFNFTTADAMVAAAQAANIKVHGHVLAWHSQTQGAYYRSLLNTSTSTGPNLVLNPGFENGDATSFTNFSVFNSGNPAGNATITVGSGATEVHAGTRSLKVINPTAYPSEQYRVQVATDLINLTVGSQYRISYWVKAATAGGSIRLSTQPTAQYQADQTIGADWQQVSWLITANDVQARVLFDMGQNSNTYFIDDMSVNEITSAGTTGNAYAIVDSLLKNNIQQIAGHFKGKVRGWDVVNEMFSDGPAGAIRNNTNTTNATANDVFVWSNYLGRDFGYKAFTYAAQADPDAKLFINDYNLEYSTAKLDSLIAYVAEIRARGAKVDGIGTQMHISINANKQLIDAQFVKLAATGLLVHISELDIGVNLTNQPSLVFTPTLETSQADMYNYVVASYMRNVPKAQRYGITIWGLQDDQSWRYKNGADFPLLYNATGAKKMAYDAVLKAIKDGL
ncbi:MAG: endo-1,4-beta-xylanase [Ferruginibacter sp.]